MEPKKIIIKKYENRRLYDTTKSRYVNLDEVAGIIRGGAELQVLDARTGEDLTRLILTQIIVEDAKDREFALPLDVLRHLVFASGRASQEGIANYWKAVSGMYQSAYKAFATPVNPLEFMRALFSPAGVQPGAPGPAPETAGKHETPTPAGSGTPQEHSAEHAELLELRRRVEELERRLAEKNENTRPAPSRRPRKLG